MVRVVVRQRDQGLDETFVSQAPALYGGLEPLVGQRLLQSGQAAQAGVLPEDDVLLETRGRQAGGAQQALRVRVV